MAAPAQSVAPLSDGVYTIASYPRSQSPGCRCTLSLLQLLHKLPQAGSSRHGASPVQAALVCEVCHGHAKLITRNGLGKDWAWARQRVASKGSGQP